MSSTRISTELFPRCIVTIESPTDSIKNGELEGWRMGVRPLEYAMIREGFDDWSHVVQCAEQGHAHALALLCRREVIIERQRSRRMEREGDV